MLQALAERHTPASALIDARHHVYYLCGPTGDYLQPPSGEPSSNLVAMAREGLQMPLRIAVRKVIDDGREATIHARVLRGGKRHPVRLVVTPVRSGRDSRSRFLVSFFERDAPPKPEGAAAGDAVLSDSQLQAELERTREDLRLTVEQMDAANEELKASNEEIRSINEELKASNEELETSKEELQSLNEELTTVNNQLQAKVGELEERTADLNNLLNSTDIATLFLDRNLAIRWFTPAMKTLFELRPTDVGRPIAHFAQRFSGDDLVDDAVKVLEKLAPTDTEVVSDDGRWYIRHMVPYRTEDDRIAGVVVSFTEITQRKSWEEEVRVAKEFAENVVNTVREPLLVLKSDLTVESANESFFAFFQITPDQTIGKFVFELGDRSWDNPKLRRLLSEILPENKVFNDFEVEREFEHIGLRTMLLNARKIDRAGLILLAFEDVTDRKKTQLMLIEELNHRVRNTLAIINSIATNTRRHAGSMEEFGAAFEGRIQSLAATHTLLAESQWGTSTLKAVINRQVRPYAQQPGTFDMSGPVVPLVPKTALALSLIFHELATNAAKHGALSTAAGRIDVAWALPEDDPKRTLTLHWTESGGPPVDPPERVGFGSKLIDANLTHEFRGEVRRDYRRDGVVCTLIIPLARLRS